MVGQRGKGGNARSAATGRFHGPPLRGRFCRYSNQGGGRFTVIYLIYKDGEILVETDDLEFVKTYVSQNEECSVRDARTGKKVPME